MVRLKRYRHIIGRAIRRKVQKWATGGPLPSELPFMGEEKLKKEYPKFYERWLSESYVVVVNGVTYSVTSKEGLVEMTVLEGEV